MCENSDGLTEQFHRLCNLAREERRRILNHIERSDPAMAGQLEGLLEANDRAEGFLDAMDASAASRLLEEHEKLAIPARAGPFSLLHELGRGGLGVVYLGERSSSDFEQKVAVKLVKHGMDSEAILRRFHSERRILASLEHPNIAHLIDGGILDDGRPWFAMEYIQGEPITRWCNRKQLGIGNRLRLFEEVCRTVQFAHSRLVIHRDLKPDNILVSETRVIKLLDFGIAKLIAEDGEEHTELTVAGNQAMTPEYAAPEQIRGEPITVATDVYALGVILYQLLTGVHPFKANTSSRAELTEAICNTEPAPPSIAIRTSGRSDLPALAVRHGLGHRRLKGDLDAIVLTALAKSPQRRYSSAEALAEDIRRHLINVPIRARHRTLFYRTGRFARRHGIGLAATGAVMLALLTGLSAALWQAGKAREQAEMALQSRDFVVSLLRETNPVRSDEGVELRAVDLLRHAAEQIKTTDEISSELRGRLQIVLTEAMLDLGRPNDALPLAQMGLAGLRNLHGDNSPEAADGLHALARVHAHLGNSREAARAARDGAAILEEQQLTSTLLFVRLLGIEANAYNQLGRYEEATALRRQIVVERARIVGENDPRMASAHYNLGTAYYFMIDFKAAERQYRRAGELLRLHAGESHPRIGNIYHGIGAALMGQGNLDEAEDSLLMAKSIVDQRIGPASTTANEIGANMGVLYRLQGRLAEAEQTLDRAATALGQVDASLREATTRSWLALVLLARGKYPDAFEQASAARQYLEDADNRSNPHYDVVRSAQALALARMGEPDQVHVLANTVFSKWPESEVTIHPARAEAMELYARLLTDAGHSDAAGEWLTRARKTYSASLGPNHARTLAVGAVYPDRSHSEAMANHPRSGPD